MRTVWRSWFWNIFGALCASAGVAIGLVMALDPATDAVTRTIYGLGGAFFLWIMIRTLFMRVKATPEGISIRGLFRSRFVRWGEVEDVTCGGSDMDIVGSISPSIYLHGFQESMKSGQGNVKLLVEPSFLTSYVFGPRTARFSIAYKATVGLNEHFDTWKSSS